MLIRQYYPRGTDFRNTTFESVQLLEDKLNNRTRMKLGYLTPKEVCDNLLFQQGFHLSRESLIR